MVARQSIDDAVIGHHDKRNTVRQSPTLVRTASKEVNAAGEQHGIRRGNSDQLIGAKRRQQLEKQSPIDRRGQGVYNLGEHPGRGDQRNSQRRVQLPCPSMGLVAGIQKRKIEVRISKNRLSSVGSPVEVTVMSAGEIARKITGRSGQRI